MHSFWRTAPISLHPYVLSPIVVLWWFQDDWQTSLCNIHAFLFLKLEQKFIHPVPSIPIFSNEMQIGLFYTSFNLTVYFVSTAWWRGQGCPMPYTDGSSQLQWPHHRILICWGLANWLHQTTPTNTPRQVPDNHHGRTNYWVARNIPSKPCHCQNTILGLER